MARSNSSSSTAKSPDDAATRRPYAIHASGAPVEVLASVPHFSSIDRPAMAMEWMHAMLAVLNSDMPTGEVLKLIAAQLQEWLRADDVIIGKLDPAAQTLLIYATQGHRADADASALLVPGLQALSRTRMVQSPVLYPYDDRAPDHAVDASPAVLAIPLSNAEGRVSGGLLLYYLHTPQLSAGELELATLIGIKATLVIKQSEQKLRDYASVIIGERNRIARELHDSVTQALYTISLITEALPSVWRSHPAEALANIETLHVLARSALAEMRTLLLELRPAEQADRNLGDLLRQLPDRIRFRSGVQVATTVVGDTPLPKPVQTALYYIAQEALNNVDKHARAGRASVQLDFRPDGAVMLCVSDNGRGIDPTTIGPNQLGLSIMRERAAEIGATLSVDSRPGQGTRVIAEWQAEAGTL